MNITNTSEQLFQAIDGMHQARSNYILAVLNTQTALYHSAMSMILNPWTVLNSALEKHQLEVQQGGKSPEAKATSTLSRKRQIASLVAVQDSSSEATADTYQ
jgi:hypothetical protein